MAPPGYLALVLHAHLPYVRHPEHPQFLEEDWLYEAITETYLPLLAMLEGLQRDAVPACFSLTLTPTLCHMLRDPLLCGRYSAHLDRLVDLARAESERNRGKGPPEDDRRTEGSWGRCGAPVARQVITGNHRESAGRAADALKRDHR